MQLPDKRKLFDALFDEEEFSATLDDIAATIGARSYIGGFAFDDGSKALSLSSGYWTQEQLAEYYASYFDRDPWNAYVLANWKPSRAVDPGKTLPDRRIEHSDLFQEFFRPIGDDTFRVVAIASDHQRGKGALAFHRGKDQRPFSDEVLEGLNSLAPDIARIMSLRGQLMGLEREIAARSSALDALNDGVILLDGAGRIVMANAIAEELLLQGRLLAQRGGRLTSPRPGNDRALADALASLPDRRFAALRLCGTDGRSLDLSLLALPPQARPARVLVAFATAPPPDRAAALRQLFGLSASEVEIALLLTDGLDPADIAEARGRTLNTVRAQLRTIGEKMECSRLIDIVRRVAALPRIGAGEI